MTATPTTWRRADAVVHRRVGRRAVLLALDAAEPVVLSETGTAVWAALDEPGTLQDVVARVADGFEVDATAIAADVTAFLGELEAVHIVVQR